MAIFTGIAVGLAGLGVATTGAAVAGGIGTAIAGASAYGTYQAGKDVSKASKEAEALRRQQMELDSRRRMTELIRTAAIARSRSTAAAASRGAINSSAFEGGSGSILSQAGANVQAQGENLALGRQMFDVNAALSNARASATNWASGLDLGKTLFQNQQAIGSIGSTLFTSKES